MSIFQKFTLIKANKNYARTLVLVMASAAAIVFLFPHNAKASIIIKLPSSLGISTGLVGYWTMDGADYNSASTTAEVTDKSGNNRNADALNGPKGSIGKVGQAMNFDGIDDYLYTESNFMPSGAVTFSLWVKPRGYTGMLITNNSTLLRIRGNGGDNNFDYRPANNASFQSTVGSVTLNVWQHVVLTRAANDDVAFYINGVLNQSGSGAEAVGVGNRNVSIGGDTFNEDLPGEMDDVRIYNRALSASEAARLYNFGSGKINSSHNSRITNGLVGLWSMDGADYNGASTTAEVLDRSGNNNNGDAINGPTRKIGKLGQALNFDGSTQNVSLPDSASLQPAAFTISAWIYYTGTIPTANSQSIVILHANDVQFRIQDTSDAHLTVVVNGAGGELDGTSASAIPNNTWTFVTTTFDGSTLRIYKNASETASETTTVVWEGGVQPPSIGSFSSSGGLKFTGKIDEVRIYNRALSAAEITQLYNMGNTPLKVNSSENTRITDGLVGQWSFNGADYNAASTTAEVLDRSGNNNNGDATNGPTRTIGKVGQALNFDGVNDYIDAGSGASIDDLGPLTYSAWVNPPAAASSYNAIVHKLYRQFYLVNFESPSVLYFGVVTSVTSLSMYASTPRPAVNTWTHVAVTWNGVIGAGAVVTFYLNGEAGTTATLSSGVGTVASDASVNLAIGAKYDGASEFFNGKMDEVRVYNRVLSAAEVKQLYLMGK